MKRRTVTGVLLSTSLLCATAAYFSFPMPEDENKPSFSFVRESHNTVLVYDELKSAPVGLFQLPVPGRVGEIKLHGDRLYYADVEKKSIFVMDIASGTVKERFKLESRPDRFWLSNRHNLLYVLSYASSLISVYSLEQNALLSQIPVGDFRGEILFDEQDDRLYLALADQSVQVIDTSLFRSEGVVNMNRDSDILHVDAVDKQVWLRQHNNQIITVVDLKTGRVIKHYGIDQ